MGFFTKGHCESNSVTLTKLLLWLIPGVICLLIALLILIFDPLFLIVKHGMRVDYDTILYEGLQKETDSVHISVYLFNITNIEQFLSGEDEKLKVDEIGPFTYQENRTNANLEIDNDAGLMRYTPKHRVTFLPEESIDDPKDVLVTMPNIAMMAMGSAVKEYGFLAAVGFNMLVTSHKSQPVVTMSAYDYLWGYNESLIQLGNQYFPGWINFDKLGLLDRLYDETVPLRVEVSSREDDKFMIKHINGIDGLKHRGYENPYTRSSCNSFDNAFEGIVYPVAMSPSRPIKIYRDVLCQFLELNYEGTNTTEYGVEALNYRINNKTFENTEQNQCLCEKKCHAGVIDLSPCFYGLPVGLSNAHFLYADPSVYDKIEGISPDEEQHGSLFSIDSVMGMALSTKFSIQLNVIVGDVKFNSKLSKFSDMMVPVVILKIVQPKLPAEQITALRSVHIFYPYIQLGIQLTIVFIGLILLSIPVRYLYCNWMYSRKKVVELQLETKQNKQSSQPLVNKIVY